MGRVARNRRVSLVAAAAAAACASAITSLAAPPVASAGPPARPFPQHQAHPGTVHAPSLYPQDQQDDQVRTAYAAWKSRYLVAAAPSAEGHARWRVRMGRDVDDATTSEAQGYGMLIAVWMAGHEPAAQAIFEGLWTFARSHPSDIDGRLMDFWIDAEESPDPFGDDSAFDGDVDMALALLLADEQWGPSPRFDYRAEALSVIAALRDSALGPDTQLPLLGDWVDPGGAIYSQYTPRSSDLVPGHFRAFASATGDATWNAVVTASQSLVEASQASHAPDTGLLPDFFEPVMPGSLPLRPADPLFLESEADGQYSYNATRVPLRLGMDALWWGDATSALAVRRLSQWFRTETGGEPLDLQAGYALDGSPLVGTNYFSAAFAAPLIVAAMITPGQQAWLDALYDACVESDEGYYEDTLALLSVLVATGNAWPPQSAAAPAGIPLYPGWAAPLLPFALALSLALAPRAQPRLRAVRRAKADGYRSPDRRR